MNVEVSSLLKNAQTEVSVSPNMPDSLRKVGQTFLCYRDFVIFQQAVSPEISWNID